MEAGSDHLVIMHDGMGECLGSGHDLFKLPTCILHGGAA
jgi:hypothetical protein